LWRPQVIARGTEQCTSSTNSRLNFVLIFNID
jgi:hypothetical protein